MASIKQAMTLFSKAGIKEDLRRQMLFSLTSGRTTSMRDLSQKELGMLCNKLNNTNSQSQQELVMRRKRSVVLKLATSTGIKAIDSWDRFNAWMLKSSVLKKPLKDYNYDELEQLLRQFRGIESNYNKSANKAGTKAWYHATGIQKPSAN